MVPPTESKETKSSIYKGITAHIKGLWKKHCSFSRLKFSNKEKKMDHYIFCHAEAHINVFACMFTCLKPLASTC